MHLELIQSRRTLLSAEQSRAEQSSHSHALGCLRNACRLLVAVFALPVLMVTIALHTVIAQIEYTARYVGTAYGHQVNLSIARPSHADYTVIVWEDYRDGASDIYAQKIEHATGLAMWEPIDGVPVCTFIGAQRNPRAAYDSLGGVIVVWEDFRDRHDSAVNDTTVMDIFAHRLLLDNGHLDTNWSANPDGVPVCVRTGQQARGPVIAGTTDGAYIAWTDYRNSTGWPNYRNTDVYVQYLLSATGTYPSGYSWVANGIDVTDPDPCGGDPICDQINPDITLDYSVNTQRERYGVFVVYEDIRLDAWRIFSSHIGADGVQLHSDLALAPVQNVSRQRNPRIAPLGVIGKPYLGAAVTWEDNRDAQSSRQDIYSQRVTIDNARGWSLLGEPVCIAARDQRRPRIAALSNPVQSFSKVLIVWEDLRDEATSGVDVYCNALDGSTGARTWNEATAGLLCDEPHHQLNPAVDIIEDFVVAWEDWRGGVTSDIYGNLLNAGDPTQYRWPGTGQAITLGKHGQSLPQVSGDVIAWQDGRRQPLTYWQADQRADTNIYAQRLGGECDLPTEMNWQQVFVQWNASPEALGYRFVVDTLGSTYAVWIENRPQDGGLYAVYVLKLDRDGVPKWHNNGVKVSNTQSVCERPDICIDGEEGCYVAWMENGSDIMLAHVDYLGDVTAVTQDAPGGDGPRLVEDDAGGAILAYNDTNAGIRLRHYDAALNLLDDVMQSGLGIAFYDVKLSKDRGGGAWFVWHDGTDYYGSAYNGAGETLIPARLNQAWGGIIPWSSITGEFDIDTDYIPVFMDPWHIGKPYDCLVTAIVDVVGAADDIITARLFESPPGFAKFSGGLNISLNPTSRTTPAGSNHQSSQPAISADSTFHEDTGTQLGGGAIYAWVNTYTHPVTNERTNCVLTERIFWREDGAGYAGVRHFGTNQEVILDDGLEFSPTPDPLPDIATVFSAGEAFDPDAPERYGMVAWTSDRYSGCTGPYAVRVQQVDYTIPNAPPGSQPKFWGIYGNDIAPLVGSVAQGPALLRSPWPGSVFSAPNSIPALWLDTRSGSPCLVSTRVYDESFMRTWNKDARVIATLDDILPTFPLTAYPHPVSISGHGAVTLAYHASESGLVRVSLFDALGRSVLPAGLHNAVKGENHLTLQLGGRSMLSPGVYLLMIEGAAAAVTRPLLFVR
jgi:hypothetical protein